MLTLSILGYFPSHNTLGGGGVVRTCNLFWSSKNHKGIPHQKIRPPNFFEERAKTVPILQTRVADPGGIYPDPDPTFEKKPDPDQTFEKKNRVRLSKKTTRILPLPTFAITHSPFNISLYIKDNTIDILTYILVK